VELEDRQEVEVSDNAVGAAGDSQLSRSTRYWQVVVLEESTGLETAEAVIQQGVDTAELVAVIEAQILNVRYCYSPWEVGRESR
jgi:hypothetical protein